MSRHHRRWTIASIAAAAGIVIAGTAWGLGAGTEPAAANGTDGQLCTASQVTATMVTEPIQTMSQARKYGAVVVKARPGEACHIIGAPPARLPGTQLRTVSDNGLPREVLVTPSSPAWIELDWTRNGSTKQTPNTVVLGLTGSSLSIPWTGGGVDQDPESGPVYVRSIQPGYAPAGFK